MKDFTTFLGLLLGLAAIVGGFVFEGGHPTSLLQVGAFLIVFGGTVSAILVQTPWPIFAEALGMLKWLLRPPGGEPQEWIEKVVEWSRVARREGLLALEMRIAGESDPFVRKGLQLLVDGIEPERIREVLGVELEVSEEHLKLCAKVWESAGGYAPTIGIIGAVLGLIHVMENLADPSQLGKGIAVAFVATVYGVYSANLIYIPLSKRLMTYIGRLILVRQMLVEGLAGIAAGDNPRLIENQMRSYLTGEEPEQEKREGK
ncbi:MAG: flagellar motor protein [Hydrogenophilus sp.]|nr:flagellar motor protein [Hydrogenophilus sp.]